MIKEICGDTLTQSMWAVKANKELSLPLLSSLSFSLHLPQDKYTQEDRIKISKEILKNKGNYTFNINQSTIVVIDQDEIESIAELSTNIQD